MSSIPMTDTVYRGLDSSERGAAEVVTPSGISYTSPLVHVPIALPLQGTEQWKRKWYDLNVFCYPSDFCLSTWCCSWLPIAHLAHKTKSFKRWMGTRGIVAAFILITFMLYNLRGFGDKAQRISLEEKDIDGDGVSNLFDLYSPSLTETSSGC